LAEDPVAELDRVLDEIVVLLEQSGEEFWRRRLIEVQSQIKSGEREEAINKLLSAYGGMGSLNDVVIRTHVGHGFDRRADYDKDGDQRFAELKEKAYELAKLIREGNIDSH
jgi:hypothetical protein